MPNKLIFTKFFAVRIFSKTQAIFLILTTYVLYSVNVFLVDYKKKASSFSLRLVMVKKIVLKHHKSFSSYLKVQMQCYFHIINIYCIMFACLYVT